MKLLNVYLLNNKIFKVVEGQALLKKARNHENICFIYSKVLSIEIPNSLAEERFENLQLAAFLHGTMDLLVSLI